MLFLSRRSLSQSLLFFFFNDTATTEIYTLSLHDALPIFAGAAPARGRASAARRTLRIGCRQNPLRRTPRPPRSEEHTSELQSHSDLVCRLLLEKKKPSRMTLNFRDKRRD